MMCARGEYLREDPNVRVVIPSPLPNTEKLYWMKKLKRKNAKGLKSATEYVLGKVVGEANG
ncbi:MAG: hypothetical protein LBR62_00930 [Puniceicoccales bacterium]|nr:hypothetical protein [Puniceicoccales bacterium]